jgi:branched-chain amino acid transport system permease protein
MEQLVQSLILGLLIGGVYALMASGLTLVFGVMRIINVAHGALLIASAMITWYIWSATGIDPFLIAILMTFVMSMSVLLTFGLALTIEGLLNVFAGNKFRSATPSYFDQSFRLGGLVFPKTQVYGAGVALIMLAVLYFILSKTWTGRAIRATSQNPTSAALIGVSATGVAALSFAIGTATAGVGGSILSVLYPFFPASHYDWISRLLGIVVLGGMGSLPGALVAALLLGLAETLTATYISLQWATLVFYMTILIVLLVRPQGLFGSQLREDVAA